MNLSKAIQTYRTSLGLSLQQVAEISGLTKTHIWEMESGKVINPTAKTLVKVANALNASPAHLFQCAVNSMIDGAKECDQ